jgi:hypothetical protein
MHEYTIKDELARDDAQAGGGADGGTCGSAEPVTMDLFSSFADLYLLPALTQRRPARLCWLQPVARLQGVLCAHLLAVDGGYGGGGEGGEAGGKDAAVSAAATVTRDRKATAGSFGDGKACAVVSLPGAASCHPLAALAGVSTGGALWDAVMHHAEVLPAPGFRPIT